jgi:hypothetical protein
MTAPILRHETGEVLGQGHYRVSGRLEQSRLFAVPTSGTPEGVEQDLSVFRGSLLAFQGAAGVARKMDLQLSGFFSAGGGGWRFGGKYQLYGDPFPGKPGAFAIAAMLGYSRFSGTGDVSLLSEEGRPMDVHQTLSATTVDVAFPVSFRLGTGFAVYSGLALFKSWVNGSVSDKTIAIQNHDYGANLGVKFNLGRSENTIELMFLRVHDPFLDEMRFVPLLGIGSGVAF